MRDAAGWHEGAQIRPSDSDVRDYFGLGVLLRDGLAVIGAVGDDENGFLAGAGYMFQIDCVDCPADLDGSGTVDFEDLLIVLDAWGPCE